MPLCDTSKFAAFSASEFSSMTFNERAADLVYVSIQELLLRILTIDMFVTALWVWILAYPVVITFRLSPL